MSFGEESGFEIVVGHDQILILGAALAIAAWLAFLMGRTRLGRTLRACADDPGAAALLGVDVGRTIGAAFVIGAGLAAVSGGFVALHYGQADFFMGYLAGFKALTAALLGGFGSVGGALVGALVIGLIEAVWSANLGQAYKDAAIFAVLILVLVLRPEGLFGSHIPRGRWRDSEAAPIMPMPSARNTTGSGRKVSSSE
jgi:branched-chain amino acid transport system permease protein